MSRNQTPAASKQTDKPLRFQFDIDPTNVQAFDFLMSDCGSRTRAELFNNAVTLLEWAVGEVKKGRMIASCDNDRQDVLPVLLPALQVAARISSRAREGMFETRKPQSRQKVDSKSSGDAKPKLRSRDHEQVVETTG